MSFSQPQPVRPSFEDIQKIIPTLVNGKIRHEFTGFTLVKMINTKTQDEEFYLQDNKPIGKGTFGVIYKAFQVHKDRIDDREIVLKSQNLPAFGEEEIAQLETETDVLQHANGNSHLARQVDEDDVETYYVIQPLLKGEDVMTPELALSRTIKQLPFHKRLELAEKLYEQLEKLHSFQDGRAYIHGDIKGANIKVHYDAKSDKLEVAFLDFGTAILVPEGQTQVASTKEFMGTPYHFDPLNVNHCCIDFTSDIYALTPIVAAILNATNPYQDKMQIVDEEEKKASAEKQKLREQAGDKKTDKKEEKENLKEMFERAKASGDLSKFHTPKHAEVKANFNLDNLGIFAEAKMEKADIELVKQFLENTQEKFKNKQEYTNRPSAIQGKVFFGLMRDLYDEKKNYSPEEKAIIRKLMQVIISKPKMSNENYNDILQISRNTELSSKNKIFLLEAFSRFPTPPQGKAILAVATKNISFQTQKSLINLISQHNTKAGITFTQAILLDTKDVYKKIQDTISKRKKLHFFRFRLSEHDKKLNQYLTQLEKIDKEENYPKKIALTATFLKEIQGEYQKYMHAIAHTSKDKGTSPENLAAMHLASEGVRKNTFFNLLNELLPKEMLSGVSLTSDAKNDAKFSAEEHKSQTPAQRL